MRRLLKVGAVVAAVLAAALPAASFVLAHGFATRVRMITPNAPEEVRVNRALWQKGDPVASIYGVPANEDVEVLFPDEARLIRPEEDPSLLLLAVDKQAGDNPLQVRTLWFLAWRVAGGLVVAAGTLWGLGAVIGARARARVRTDLDRRRPT